jgi:hypothetical protein
MEMGMLRRSGETPAETDIVKLHYIKLTTMSIKMNIKCNYEVHRGGRKQQAKRAQKTAKAGLRQRSKLR